MNSFIEIAVRVLVGAAVFAAAPAGGAQAVPGRSGPWAFGALPGSEGAVQMATTPAAEDPDVWFLLVCDGTRLGAAVMHATGFSYAIAPGSAIGARFAGHPALAAVALPIGENQVSVDETAARRLMPLIIESEQVLVSISGSEGAAHDYTFALQPNGLALAGIVRGCWDDR
jgi:hypothetical protein